MQLTAVFTEENAVSSVIGTVLMVAVVVILAAVLGVFVFDVTDRLDSAPQAGFDVTYDVDGVGANNTTIEMASGSELNTRNLYVQVGDDRAWEGTSGAQSGFAEADAWPSSTIESGDALTIEEDTAGSGTIKNGDEVAIYWKDGETSTILSKATITA